MVERLRRLGREEGGFTLLEVMIASLILVIGVLAVIGVFDSSRRLTTVSEKEEVVAHRAEAELERIQSMPFAAVALAATPSHATDSADPDFYVTAGAPPTYRWDQGSSGPKTDPLVVDGANGQVSHLATWNDGQSRLSGSIYRYVTAVNDGCCTGSNYARRVTIAVTVNSGGGLAKPILLSSIVIDPKAG
jgi:prepilin-type N-terminal cleavage/methylation domain-containing protein